MHISRSKSLFNILNTWLISKSLKPLSWNSTHSEVAGTLEERIRILCVLDTLKTWSETIRLNSAVQEQTSCEQKVVQSWLCGAPVKDPTPSRGIAESQEHYQAASMGRCGLHRSQEAYLTAFTLKQGTVPFNAMWGSQLRLRNAGHWVPGSGRKTIGVKTGKATIAYKDRKKTPF